MKQSRFTEQQIAFILHQAEEGVTVEEVCRKAGISIQTYYRWRLLESLLAYDCYLRATDDSRMWHDDDFLAAQRMLEKALLLSPGFPPALATFALHRMSSWVEPKGRPDWRGWDDPTPLEQAVGLH